MLVAVAMPVNAQTDIKLSLNAMNPLIYNPAYAGSYDGLSIQGTHSTQWVGFEGAPETQYLSVHNRFTDSKVGAGLSIINDNAGPVKEMNFEGNFSYTIELNDAISMAMGVKGGVNNFTLDYNLLSVMDPDEISGSREKFNQMSPVAGVGFYVFTERLFAGISTPNILTTKYYDEFENKIAKDSPSIYATIGYQFLIEEDIKLTPSLLYRYTEGAESELFFMAMLDWKNFFYGGLNIEVDSSVGAFAGFRVFDNFKAGYSYDTSVSRFRTYNQGVHSFYLSFELPNEMEHERKAFNVF